MTDSKPSADTLSRLFERAELLPLLPAYVYRLAESSPNDERTLGLLIETIEGSNALRAAFTRLCLAHQIEPGQSGPESMRAGILLLGVRQVLRFATVFTVLQSVSYDDSGCLFDPRESGVRTARYGLMAECLFANPARTPEPGDFLIQELLQELPRALLALQAPGAYNRVHINSLLREISFDRSFEQLFDRPLAELGAAALTGWGLDAVNPETCHGSASRASLPLAA